MSLKKHFLMYFRIVKKNLHVIELQKIADFLTDAIMKYKAEITSLKEKRFEGIANLDFIKTTLYEQEQVIEEQKTEI